MKVLLVAEAFPPAERPLELVRRLPALGIETHVLVPDPDEDAVDLHPPTQAWVHRAPTLGGVRWSIAATPAALRIVREEGIDAVVTTAAHAAGAVVKRATGVRWLADLGDGGDGLIARGERAFDGLVCRYADAVVDGRPVEQLAESLLALT